MLTWKTNYPQNLIYKDVLYINRQHLVNCTFLHTVEIWKAWVSDFLKKNLLSSNNLTENPDSQNIITLHSTLQAQSVYSQAAMCSLGVYLNYRSHSSCLWRTGMA